MSTFKFHRGFHRNDATFGAVFLDRMLLVISAGVVSTLLFSYLFVAERRGLTDDVEFLLFQTVLLVAWTALFPRTSPWRRRKLRLRWLFIAASVGLLMLHIVTVGTFVVVYHPRWTGIEWTAVITIEITLMDIVLSWFHQYCTMDRRPMLTAFLAQQARAATGHFDVDDSTKG